MAKKSKLLKKYRRYSLYTLVVLATIAAATGLYVVFRAEAASPPVSGGYYQVTAPGTAFKSDATCSAEVLGRNNPWEPRPQNYTANHTINPNPQLLAKDTPDWNSTWNNTYTTRVTGNFQGTTDQILQWVACKWGWGDDLLRAEAIQESNWIQAGTGDNEPRSNGHCPYDISGDPCPTSYGILQTKWYYHPPITAVGGTVTSSSDPSSSYPWIRTSTAFEADYFGAFIRGCYDGHSTYFGSAARGNIWGCIQAWYDGGSPFLSGGGSYSSSVQNYYNSKPWLSNSGTWADQSGTITPKTGDVNGDGRVNATDLSILASHYNQGGSSSQGDLNGDGVINVFDLSILASHWGT